MSLPIRVLMITSEWPTPERPFDVPFIVRQVEFLRRAGVQVEVFAFRGGKRPANYWRAWRQVRALLRANRFDLIHAQWGQSALLALGSRLPRVITYRGDDLEGIIGAGGRSTWAGRLLSRLSALLALTARQVIVVSDSLGKKLPRRDYHVIPSGLDLQLFRPLDKQAARARLGLPAEGKLLLFAGSAGNPRKRFGLLQTAVDQLNGDPPAQLVAASGVAHEDMPHYMAACDLLLLASLHEGSPNVVKEALACNLRVVSTDVGDVRQRLAGLPGCIVTADDRPETLTAAIRAALAYEGPFDGRQTVAELDENHLVERVLGVYRLAITRRRDEILLGERKTGAQ